MGLLIFGAIVAGIFFYVSHKNKKKAEAAARRAHVEKLAYAALKFVERMNEAKTGRGQANNAGRAISIMLQAAEFAECRSVMLNYDEVMEQLEAAEKVAMAVDAVARSYKHRFKGSDKSELAALLDALYEIKKTGATNQDFIDSMLTPDGLGELVTIEGIRKRCKELGWEGR